MATIHRLGKARIAMFPDDHNPPHFHLLTPDYAALVDIASLEVLEESGRPDASARDALEWARANKALLAMKWIELNERG